MLIVAGTGRNVGKTSFVCAVIRQISKTQEVIGIKISPHVHQISSSEKIIKKSANYQIVEELNTENSKDSSRMLQAGASRVFYVQTKTDEALSYVIKDLKQFWSSDTPIVCESGGLRHFVDPGLFLVYKSDEQSEMKPHLKTLESKVDQFVLFNEAEFDFDLSKIRFENSRWTLTSM